MVHVCIACSAGCSACSSATVCTVCDATHVLIDVVVVRFIAEYCLIVKQSVLIAKEKLFVMFATIIMDFQMKIIPNVSIVEA